MNSEVRIMGEIRRLKANCPPGIRIESKPDNIRYFDAWIKGPQGTSFENGTFHCEIFLTEKYPLEPPKVLMRTKIYHPNFDRIGRICLDILKKNWTPVMTIETTVLSIQSLIESPCLDDPLDTQIAEHYSRDPSGAAEKAKEWTLLYAK